MMYLTVLFKNPESVNVPSNIDRDTWIADMQSAVSDFETNYKDSVTRVYELRVGGSEVGITEVDYATFKSKIDGETVTWENVSMIELPEAYYLYVFA